MVFLKDHQIAVLIGFNTTRERSSLFDISPTLRWVDMLNTVYSEPQHRQTKERLIRDILAVNYVGLVQIKNFGKFSTLLQEIWLLLRYRWTNLFSLKFWFFSLGSILVPAAILLPMTDWYKNRVGEKNRMS